MSAGRSETERKDEDGDRERRAARFHRSLPPSTSAQLCSTCGGGRDGTSWRQQAKHCVKLEKPDY